MLTDRKWLGFYAAGWLLSAGAMTAAFRLWRLRLREAEQRAEEAERTSDEVARRRAVEERLRIATIELPDHDSISVIQVQAGVAVHLARKRGEEVPPALLAIHEAGADAARELRATLGVLRTEDHDASEDCDGSGLSQLDGMVIRARSAGLPVTLSVTGTQRLASRPRWTRRRTGSSRKRSPTPAATRAWLEAAAVEVSASVVLHYAQDFLTVQVHDDGDGVGAMSAGPGLGLIGMRERVSALGGRLHTGPREGGGFQVRAEASRSGIEFARLMIRVLLADDQTLIRSGIRSLLEAEDDIEVVAEATDGRQAVVLTAQHRPDIALMDIQMPAVDGIEATRQIVADERLNSVRVVILTNFGLDEYIFRALRRGGRERLPAEGLPSPPSCCRRCAWFMRGDSLLSPSVTRRLIGEFVARPPGRGLRYGDGDPH